METIAKVRRLFHKDQLSQREIAKKLQLDRRTVRKYLNSTELPRYQRENTLSSKLGPFKTHLIERLEAQMLLPKHQRLSAVRHFEWLCSLGFGGKYPCTSFFIKKFNQDYQPSKVIFIPKYFPCGASPINLTRATKKSVSKGKLLNLVSVILDSAIPKPILYGLIHDKPSKC